MDNLLICLILILALAEDVFNHKIMKLDTVFHLDIQWLAWLFMDT